MNENYYQLTDVFHLTFVRDAKEKENLPAAFTQIIFGQQIPNGYYGPL